MEKEEEKNRKDRKMEKNEVHAHGAGCTDKHHC